MVPRRLPTAGSAPSTSERVQERQELKAVWGSQMRYVLHGPTSQNWDRKVGPGGRWYSIQEGNAQHPELMADGSPCRRGVQAGGGGTPSNVATEESALAGGLDIDPQGSFQLRACHPGHRPCQQGNITVPDNGPFYCALMAIQALEREPFHRFRCSLWLRWCKYHINRSAGGGDSPARAGLALSRP